MTHRHQYARTFVTLTLPDHEGRYELYQSFDCYCGEGASCTSWARNTGRHLGTTELQAVQARERTKPGRRISHEPRMPEHQTRLP